jgi:hypothetical protein
METDGPNIPKLRTDPLNTKYTVDEKNKNPLDTQVGGNHYKNFKIQPIEFSIKNDLNFIQGDIVKRICRYNVSGGKGRQDLEKIKHEIDLLIYLEYGDPNEVFLKKDGIENGVYTTTVKAGLID